MVEPSLVLSRKILLRFFLPLLLEVLGHLIIVHVSHIQVRPAVSSHMSWSSTLVTFEGVSLSLVDVHGIGVLLRFCWLLHLGLLPKRPPCIPLSFLCLASCGLWFWLLLRGRPCPKQLFLHLGLLILPVKPHCFVVPPCNGVWSSFQIVQAFP